MEYGVLSPAAMLGASTDLAMDFDFMDELMLEGCWLETTDGSEFLQQDPNDLSCFFDSPSVWSNSENGNAGLIMNQSQESGQEERQRSLLPWNLPVDETQGKSSQSLGRNVAKRFDQSESSVSGGSEVSRRWWIGPQSNPGSGFSVMERLIWALGSIKDFTRDNNALIQLWVPVNRGGRCVLTTNDQPFSLDPNCPRLVGYRDISVTYHFPADKDSKEIVGLPGRVFLGKVPEWTPDVRFFRSDEYPRVDDAQRYDVRGTLALPVFEQGSRTCLGVLEVVTTTQRIKYRTELESVCRALEAVDLRSSEPSATVNVKECNMSYQAIFPEIQEVLRAACETHRLPLAQTWVPCIQQGKGGCWHSDENYACCVSTEDSACYVADPDFYGFYEACSEHHLLKGQGIAGGAFLTNQPCFFHDITSFSKTEYPLSHHARMFRLRAAVAIRLRSIYTGKSDFVLEFFLPADCVDPEEQRKMLGSLSTIIQQACQSLRVVTDKELEEETDEVATPSDSRPTTEAMSKVECTHLERRCPEDSSWGASLTEIQQNDNVVSPLQKEEHMDGDKSSECRQHNEDSSFEESPDFSEDHSIFGDFSSISKIGERRRTKAEKNITLEVLRQYFAGSLKDAAKNIGVCPTTLKRICRQHGIKRWPSRKIKKVGHSLQKLQRVIDSVQGSSGSMQIGSFYSNFPELASPNLSRNGPFSTSKSKDHPKDTSLQDVSNFSRPVTVPKSPSSSCSHSSNSSQLGSSGAQPHQNPEAGENSLKKVRSDAELYVLTKEESNFMTRSYSHNNLNNHPIREGNSQRVKVAYGEENIRFQMQSHWGFKELLQEIGRRFSIEKMSRFDVKYMDDDSEWILLTCDADLEECADVCRSSQTIKLSLQPSHHLGSSFGNSAPSW